MRINETVLGIILCLMDYKANCRNDSSVSLIRVLRLYIFFLNCWKWIANLNFVGVVSYCNAKCQKQVVFRIAFLPCQWGNVCWNVNCIKVEKHNLNCLLYSVKYWRNKIGLVINWIDLILQYIQMKLWKKQHKNK